MTHTHSHYLVTFERPQSMSEDTIDLDGWAKESHLIVGRNKVDVTAVVEAAYGDVRNVEITRLRRL